MQKQQIHRQMRRVWNNGGLWWVLLIQATQVFQVDQQREFIVNHVDRKTGELRLSVRVRALSPACMHAVRLAAT